MNIATWVLSALLLVETLALFRIIGRMNRLIDAPPRPRRRAMRRMLRLVGLWQLTIAGFIALFNARQGEGWASSIASITALGMLGVLFLFAPWAMAPGLQDVPGEDPDLRDPEDVERWLGED